MLGSIGYICTIPMVYEFFVAQMMSLVHHNITNGIDVSYHRAIHGSQAHARNELVNKMEGDWLLMLDTDMQFDANVFEVLSKAAIENKVEVLSGLYYQRSSPHVPLCYVQQNDEFYSWDPFQAEATVVPIDASGGGCLLVHRNVFNRITDELHEKPFAIEGTWSEDFSFFRRLKKLGIQAWLTKDVILGHYTLTAVGKKEFENAK